MELNWSKTPFFLPLHLIFKPIVGSVCISLLWLDVFHTYGLNVGKANESAFTDMLVPTLAVFHAIVAGGVLSKVWNEYTLVKRCIRKDDRETFKECLHERIPRAIHLLLLVLSIAIQGACLVLHYEGWIAGVFVNFCIAFTLILYWEVATNLDNPRKAVWFTNQIPEAWLVDVDEVFAKR